MQIRKALDSDLQSLVELFKKYLLFYKRDFSHDRCEAFLLERLKNYDSAIYVAESDEKFLAGFIQLYPIFSSLSQKRSWILNDLFVDESVRGMGVGKKLLDTAQEHSFKSGANGLSLQTAIDNVSAQKLYQKNGWVKESEFSTYYFNH